MTSVNVTTNKNTITVQEGDATTVTVSTVGPQGASITGSTGATGATGTLVRSGSSAPTSGDGNDGDWWIETTNSRLYGPKASGAWPGSYVSLIGPQGAQGDQGVQGSQGVQGETGLNGGSNIVLDSTPQLGGDLDANGNDIDMGTNVITDARVGEWLATKTKVDGIENSATADMTGSEIKSAYEGESNTNAFTDTEKTKLSGIATSANNYAISSDLLDEDNMSTNSATKVPSQQSVKAYVDANSSDTTYTAGTGLNLSGTEFSVTSLALTTVQEAANETQMLALTTQEGDVVVRTDSNQSFVKNAGTAGTMADFTLLRTPTDAVLSVNGNTGAITAAQIASAVESAADSNTFSDADHTKLNSVESNSTADQTSAEIKTLLNSDGLVNAQVDGSAAIDGTKISPDFGDQNIVTTGQFQCNGSYPRINLHDSNSENDFSIRNNNGQFMIHDDDTDLSVLNINNDGSTDVKGRLDAEAGIDVTGNIAVTGTVDGRDVATDGSKLDGIATGAEVNVQSDWNSSSGDSQILNKPTIPTNTDTTYSISCVDGDNTDEEKIRLTAGGDGSGTDDVVLEAGTGLSIARSGDKITFTNTVTDTNTQLTTEEVQDIIGAMVAGGNTETNISVTYDDTNGKLDFVSTDTTYSIQDGQLSQNNFTDADHTKLDGIATSANNYSISSDLLDEDNMSSDSATKVPSQQSVKAYVDANTGTTNLSNTANGTSLTVESSTGSNTTLPAATTSAWGVMTDDDKTKLDGIATGATSNVGDITGVTAGTGLSGGGNSGAVTVNADVGIADDKLVQIDDADAADDDYAKFTANGIEGRSYAEVKTDLSLNNVENTAVSTWAGSTNITTLGTVSTVTSTANGTAGVRKITLSTSSASGGSDGDVWIKYTA